MPIKRPQLVNGEIYHIVIRAVEGTKLFRDKNDYLRFLHDLFEFNDEDPVDWSHRWHYWKPNNLKSTRTVLVEVNSNTKTKRKKRKLLVEILAFCLMPNHVHLLVRQIRDEGVSKFMRKIGAGYGIYYNNRYERKGHVFGGKFKAVLIKNNEQLKTVFVYIHSNPVAIIVHHWKEEGIKIKDLKKIIKFLENYKWSSYSDYLEKKNYPSITNRELLTKIMGGPKGCREFIKAWLFFKKELADFKEIAIE